MAKLIYVFTVAILCVVLPIVCVGMSVESVTDKTLDQTEKDKSETSTQESSSNSTGLPVLPADIRPAVPLQDIGATGSSKTSSEVFEDGSFEFKSQSGNISIRVHGELRQIEGRQALMIYGSYNNTDAGVAAEFLGSEKNGFIIEPYASIFAYGLMPRVIASIIG